MATGHPKLTKPLVPLLFWGTKVPGGSWGTGASSSVRPLVLLVRLVLLSPQKYEKYQGFWELRVPWRPEKLYSIPHSTRFPTVAENFLGRDTKQAVKKITVFFNLRGT